MANQKLKIILPMHTRKQNRLPGYDYSGDGMYFVTICIKNRVQYFGDVKKEKIILNKYGKIAQQQWLWLEQQYPYIELGQFIIMPNHVHGIIVINSDNINNTGTGHNRDNVGTGRVGTGRDLSLRDNNKNNFKIKSLSELIGAFKTTSSKMIHESGLDEFKWQRSFYDHIIRNHKSLQAIRRYIYYNPAKWESDRNNLENLYM